MMNEILKRRGYTRREFHATLAKLGLGFTAVAAIARPSVAFIRALEIVRRELPLEETSSLKWMCHRRSVRSLPRP